ncbi:hypothetical protein HNR42_002654 [Deinobacterium chartae]|uniref:Uncharacterized protein n=1 Tax=Deinobacterium chartae TaxID=521158 RepID=A0A841I2C8_9DEIO|nr:hypothetical protein [Deinobacterium chartae]MBB6099216.1 hypothetical protein [Deinobacterium chartae]
MNYDPRWTSFHNAVESYERRVAEHLLAAHVLHAPARPWLYRLRLRAARALRRLSDRLEPPCSAPLTAA